MSTLVNFNGFGGTYTSTGPAPAPLPTHVRRVDTCVNPTVPCPWPPWPYINRPPAPAQPARPRQPARPPQTLPPVRPVSQRVTHRPGRWLVSVLRSRFESGSPRRSPPGHGCSKQVIALHLFTGRLPNLGSFSPHLVAIKSISCPPSLSLSRCLGTEAAQASRPPVGPSLACTSRAFTAPDGDISSWAAPASVKRTTFVGVSCINGHRLASYPRSAVSSSV